MQNLLNDLKALLEQDERLVLNGKLVKNKIIELSLVFDKELIKKLISNETIKNHFFVDVDSVLVFDKIKFVRFVSNKNFLPNSFTSFKNKIGLIREGDYNDDFITKRNDVVLAWPYKDCYLQGGQTKVDDKRSEIFWNETLAPDQIDRLLEPKCFTNWKRYNKDAALNLTEIKQNDNFIIKGNNLLVLHSLKKQFAGKVKLIYIDPPYNTGSDSFLYNDSFNHSTWLTFMKNRLVVAKDLLKNDGSIWVQCDDNEQAYLRILLDEIFGRENFINLITIKTKIAGVSGSSEGGSLQDNCEYINFYAKQKEIFKVANNIYDKIELFDFIKGMEDNNKSWKYTSILDKVDDGEYIKSIEAGNGDEIKIYKHTNYSIKSVNEIARVRYNNDIKKAYYYEINKIFRTTNAQSSIRQRIMDENIPDNLISIEYVPIKGKNKNKITKLYYKDSIRNLITFLSEVVVKENDKIYKQEKKGTLWDTINYNNITKDGNVKFENGKKPEELLYNILHCATDESDIVLDFFSGSGTTAATALKMNRRFITIEQMDYIENLPFERLKNVVNGDQSGISKEVNWIGGGDVVYCELMKWNQEYLEKIEQVQTQEELLLLINEMQKKAFLDYLFNKKTFDEHIDDFKEMDIIEQKKFMISILDKNQLYLSYSEIDDETFKVSAEDKRLNKMFYDK